MKPHPGTVWVDSQGIVTQRTAASRCPASEASDEPWVQFDNRVEFPRFIQDNRIFYEHLHRRKSMTYCFFHHPQDQNGSSAKICSKLSLMHWDRTGIMYIYMYIMYIIYISRNVYTCYIMCIYIYIQNLERLLACTKDMLQT